MTRMMAITCAKIALRMRFRFVVEPVGVQACDGVYLDWMMVFTSAKKVLRMRSRLLLSPLA